MKVSNTLIGDTRNTLKVRSIEYSFNSKIELFMQTHVLPLFNPKIYCGGSQCLAEKIATRW